MGSAACRRCAGPGVIGKTPLLRPGEMFEYTSGTPLSTPSGFMGGTYQMVDEAGVKPSISKSRLSRWTRRRAQRQLNRT